MLKSSDLLGLKAFSLKCIGDSNRRGSEFLPISGVQRSSPLQTTKTAHAAAQTHLKWQDPIAKQGQPQNYDSCRWASWIKGNKGNSSLAVCIPLIIK
jgi:hypothetical protein